MSPVKPFPRNSDHSPRTGVTDLELIRMELIELRRVLEKFVTPARLMALQAHRLPAGTERLDELIEQLHHEMELEKHEGCE